MMENTEILNIIEQSFIEYLKHGARSNKKLYVLHGAISKDLGRELGPEYTVESLGVHNNKERRISGRYMDKSVDITISKNGKILGGVAVKYVMSNYAQNSNNYFENMLGETANIRCSKIAYFQIMILQKYMPYFNNNGKIKKTEEVSRHQLEKYVKISQDDPQTYMHTPVKTLLMLVEHENKMPKISNRKEYENYYLTEGHSKIKTSDDEFDFDATVVYNNYSKFVETVVNYIRYLDN